MGGRDDHASARSCQRAVPAAAPAAGPAAGLQPPAGPRSLRPGRPVSAGWLPNDSGTRAWLRRKAVAAWMNVLIAGDRGDHRGDRGGDGGADLARAGDLGDQRAQAVRAVVPGVPARLALRAVPRPAGQGAVERVRAQPAPARLGPAVAPADAPGGVGVLPAVGGRDRTAARPTTSTGRSSRRTTGARSPAPPRTRTTASGASRCSRCSWRPRCSPSAGPRCCGTPGSSPTRPARGTC